MIEDTNPLDIQNNLLQMIRKMIATDTLWGIWDAMVGFPDQKIKSIPKPLIYILPPFHNGIVLDTQGVNKVGHAWSVVIGAWDENKSGGVVAISSFQGEFIKLFTDPNLVYNVEYDVTYYTGAPIEDTNLYSEGIIITDVNGPAWVKALVEQNEYRIEFEVVLVT